MNQCFLINKLSNQLNSIGFCRCLDCNLLAFRLLIDKISTLTVETSRWLEAGYAEFEDWRAFCAFELTVVQEKWWCAIFARGLVRTQNTALLLSAGTTEISSGVFEISIGAWYTGCCIDAVCTSLQYLWARCAVFLYRIQSIRRFAFRTPINPSLILAFTTPAQCILAQFAYSCFKIISNITSDTLICRGTFITALNNRATFLAIISTFVIHQVTGNAHRWVGLVADFTADVGAWNAQACC